MAAIQEKSFCVLEYEKSSSVTSDQRAFLRKYGKAAPGQQSILRWFHQFPESGLDDVPLLPWPPRSPDLTPYDFFLWGYVKDKVYVPPMPTTLQALQERITAAVTDIDENVRWNVWTELDHRVCRMTKGAHIGHL
ncbi:hypothetical protein AVEN_175558-1 [Araneus ventricosus]|uniref:DUF4817 domain-containing protein n=1 Tax=Araneus ventricosus TaxID=182803 RepID=A0A4Y2CP72_ARAVE|nr:hypothetical protein AVEN_175558-1 [Araneus ventricosus]